MWPRSQPRGEERLGDPPFAALLAKLEGTPIGSVMTRLDPDYEGKAQMVGGPATQSATAAYPFMAPFPAPIHKKTTRSPSFTRPARRSSSSRIRVLAADVLP